MEYDGWLAPTQGFDASDALYSVACCIPSIISVILLSQWKLLLPMNELNMFVIPNNNGTLYYSVIIMDLCNSWSFSHAN